MARDRAATVLLSRSAPETLLSWRPTLSAAPHQRLVAASHLSHPGCIKNADRSAGTGDGTIFAVRRA